MAEMVEPTGAEPAEVVRDERGMTTAEYAVGIVAACTLAGVLITVVSMPEFRQLMWELVSAVLRHFIKVG
ncbi:hypothetical protein GCM10027418_32380 [Mariniluteicoccus endophyticus]